MFKWKNVLSSPSDDMSDRVSHLLTSLLLISAALIAYHRTTGRILHCRAPFGIEFTLQAVPPLHYVEQSCAMRPLYAYNEEIMQTKSKRAVDQANGAVYVLDWAPFVPSMLAFSALLAFSPTFIRLLCCQSRALDYHLIGPMPAEVHNRVYAILADRILKKKLPDGHWFMHKQRKTEQCHKFLSGPLIWHFLFKFWSMAVLTIVFRIVITIFPLADDAGLFEAVGSIFIAAVSGKNSGQSGNLILHKLFPTEFICPVPRPPGTKGDFFDYRCVFSLNSMYGCLFFILATWLTVALIVQAISTISWALVLFVSRVKRSFLERAMENSDNRLKFTESFLDSRFMYLMMTPDTILVLYQLRAYAGQYAVEETVKMLYDMYRGREEKKKNGKDHTEVMV